MASYKLTKQRWDQRYADPKRDGCLTGAQLSGILTYLKKDCVILSQLDYSRNLGKQELQRYMGSWPQTWEI